MLNTLKDKSEVVDVIMCIMERIEVGVSFISSIDDEGFTNMKAMLSPRKRDGIKDIYFTTNTSSMRVSQYNLNGDIKIIR